MYDSCYEYLSKGAIIRSRATWYEYGEKSNKYFLNLETHRKSKSCIRKAYTKDGFVTSEPKKIMKELESFYSDLYKRDELKPRTRSLIRFYGRKGSRNYSIRILSCVKAD